jgi:hypothetical protein
MNTANVAKSRAIGWSRDLLGLIPQALQNFQIKNIISETPP